MKIVIEKKEISGIVIKYLESMLPGTVIKEGDSDTYSNKFEFEVTEFDEKKEDEK